MTMRRAHILWLIAGLLGTDSASAAELPVWPPAPSGAPYANVAAYDWTGPYVGINGGWAWGQSRQDQTLPPVLSTGDFNASGGLVGGTVGFNLQVGRFLYGLEGDLDWADIRGNTVCRLGAFVCTTQSDYLATARARVGVAWSGGFLTYVTGGAALGSINQSFTPAVGTNNGTTSNQVGWTVGGGLEIGLWNWMSSNWAVKFEYLYVDFPAFSCSIACSGIAGQTTNTTLTESIFRAGINYRF
jgi:outer membrane immunogenic protein